MDLNCNGLNSAFNSGEEFSNSTKAWATCNSNSVGAWDKILLDMFDYIMIFLGVDFYKIILRHRGFLELQDSLNIREIFIKTITKKIHYKCKMFTIWQLHVLLFISRI